MSTKKQAILNAIYERAYELEQETIKTMEILYPSQKIDYCALESAALKKAIQEFEENKAVFKMPSI